jgi:hypothetical protein
MKMPKFTKQYHKNTCFPTALLNIIKWAGFSVSYKKSIKNLIDRFGLRDKNEGTSLEEIDYYLKNNCFVLPKRIIFDCTEKQIDNELQKKRGVLLVYSFSEKEQVFCHTVFIAGGTKNSFKIVNWHGQSKTVELVSKKKISYLLKKFAHSEVDYPVMWSLEKKSLTKILE